MDDLVGNQKGKYGKWIVLSVVIALVLAVLVAGLLTEWFGFAGPMTKVGLASAKLISGESGTADYEISVERVRAEGTLCWQVDLEERLFLLSGDVRLGVVKVHFGVYEDNLLIWVGNGQSKTIDISKHLQQLFDDYAEKNDWKASLQQMLTQVLESLEIQEEVDVEKAVGCLLPAFLQMNRTPWLESHFGMSQEKEDGTQTYTFRPDMENLADSVLPFFEKAFLSREGYEASLEKLRREGASIDRKLEPVMEIAIRQGQPESLRLELMVGGKSVVASLEFSDLGRTRVDTASMEEMLGNE